MLGPVARVNGLQLLTELSPRYTVKMKEVPDRAPDLLTFIWTGNMAMTAVRR